MKLLHLGRQRINWNIFFIVIAAVVLLNPEMAWATTTASDMPYEKSLDILTKSLTGPFAYFVGMAGVVGGVCMFLWGQELGVFVKGMAFIACGISTIAGAAKVFTILVPGAMLI